MEVKVLVKLCWKLTPRWKGSSQTNPVSSLLSTTDMERIICMVARCISALIALKMLRFCSVMNTEQWHLVNGKVGIVLQKTLSIKVNKKNVSFNSHYYKFFKLTLLQERSWTKGQLLFISKLMMKQWLVGTITEANSQVQKTFYTFKKCDFASEHCSVLHT